MCKTRDIELYLPTELESVPVDDADKLDRLMCDCCQGYHDRYEELTRSGDELLCEECANGQAIQSRNIL